MACWLDSQRRDGEQQWLVGYCKTYFHKSFPSFKGKTGFISVGDLESVVETLGMNITEEAIMEMIDKFDLKRSGEIDFDEFVEMMASTKISQLSEEEEIRMIFRVRSIGLTIRGARG